MSSEAVDRLERMLGIVLRAGVVASTALLAVGLIFLLVTPARPWGPTIATIGLLILIATPVARVVTSVAQFAVERDWLFTALTATVLVILFGSLLIALGT